MTPEEYGERIAASWPPITDRQAEQAARILASVHHEPPSTPAVNVLSRPA